MQRTLIIATITIVILGLGVFAYFYFFQSGPGVAVTPTGTTSLPFAGQTGTAAQGQASGTPIVASPGTPVTVSSRLIQISKGPVVAGEAVTTRKIGAATSSPSTTVVTYIERQSGNVYTFAANTRTLTRINNKTLPGIQSALWLPDATAAFVRYLSGADFSTINTYALSASSSQGFFLPQNLSSISVSDAGVLTIASGVNGSIASLQRTDGTHSSTLFTTPLTSIRASFAGKNQYLVFSKPSSSLAGSAYLVSSGGRFSRIAGPHNGLVALPSPSGKWFLVSYSEAGRMHLELVNTSTGIATALPISTIADKCAWTSDDASIYCGVPIDPPSAAYPDDWYQGAVQFSDRIWNIHVADRYAQMVLDFPTVSNASLDAQALTLDASHTTLVFMNKNDDSLWSYTL